MKKIILFLAAMVLLTGCKEYKRTEKAETDQENPGLFDQVIKFEYEGHKYIWFRGQTVCPYSVTWDGGIVHDPDCPCMVDYD